MEKSGNKVVLALVIDAVLIIAYAAVTLLLAITKDTAFWVVFSSTIVVIASQLIFLPIVTKRTDGIIFAIPSIRIGYGAMVAQFVYTYICLRYFHLNDGKFIIAGQVLILAIYIVLEIFSMSGMSYAQQIEDSAVKNTNISSAWAVTGKMICDALKGTEYEKKANTLYDELKYANPKSNSNVMNIEQEISNLIDTIRTKSNSDNKDGISNLMDDCMSRIKERNELCKLYK